MKNRLIINHVDYDQIIETAKFKLRERINGVVSSGEMLERKSNLLIVSDGMPLNTHIYCNGQELRNVESVEILKITAGEFVRAKIQVVMPLLHIRAESDMQFKAPELK